MYTRSLRYLTIVTTAVCVYPSFITAVVVADNGTMHLWDWKTGYNFQRIQSQVQPGSLDSEAGIFACTFDMSGSRLITAESDKTVKIYREDELAVRSTAFGGRWVKLSGRGVCSFVD